MSEQIDTPASLTADVFLTMDQRGFADDRCRELIDGRVIAHDVPSPDHGAILASLAGALGSRWKGRKDGRVEVGSGAIPRRTPSDTARIPDALIRCGGSPRLIFEIVSSSDLANRKAWDRRRRDLQDVEGVEEIVELFEEPAAHIYRRLGSAWTFEALDGLDAALVLRSVGLEIPLAEIYAFVELQDENARQTG
jgi:Uma2 family endonuclease